MSCPLRAVVLPDASGRVPPCERSSLSASPSSSLLPPITPIIISPPPPPKPSSPPRTFARRTVRSGGEDDVRRRRLAPWTGASGGKEMCWGFGLPCGGGLMFNHESHESNEYNPCGTCLVDKNRKNTLWRALFEFRCQLPVHCLCKPACNALHRQPPSSVCDTLPAAGR